MEMDSVALNLWAILLYKNKILRGDNHDVRARLWLL